MDQPTETLRVDRTTLAVRAIGQEPSDLAYWLDKTPEQRLHAVELMRQVMYGYAPDSQRLQRVLETAQRAPR